MNNRRDGSKKIHIFKYVSYVDEEDDENVIRVQRRRRRRRRGLKKSYLKL
jgi:hypothetical protein